MAMLYLSMMTPTRNSTMSTRAPKTISKYIESEDDLEYSIRCQALPKHRWLQNRKGNVLEFGVTIDGEYQLTKCLSFDHWDNGVSTDILGVPAYTSRKRGTLRKFQFGSINVCKNKLKAAALTSTLGNLSLTQRLQLAMQISGSSRKT